MAKCNGADGFITGEIDDEKGSSSDRDGERNPAAGRQGVARYRFFNAPDAAFTNFFGREEDDTYRMHSISVGVQVSL
ncbi:hypothetical protein [Sphingomicrobium sediminis]|uniref:Uncharacterized protein n=1 Tax=Sphingomicrobium sediminis TaxID=2950949 RepID=A0A9X2J0G6_9SPHN|nr:hypothetical protein [Sphingomicrobium sediminis]MCM8556253.1 hypothetical protein [Sphingomicrobium sediminis]